MSPVDRDIRPSATDSPFLEFGGDPSVLIPPVNRTISRSPAADATPSSPASPTPGIERIEELLLHFEQIEAQLHSVRDALFHSHRLVTLGTLAAILVHEFNNILTPLLSYAQFADARPDDAALQRKTVEKAHLAAERAARLCSSVLGFARPDDVEPTLADLPAIVQQTLLCLARDPRRDGIDLKLDLPDVRVAIAPSQLQQVLLNLLLNARKALVGRRGAIQITGRLNGDQVRLSIIDNGPGIPPAIRERLFQPFVTHPIDSESPVNDRQVDVRSQSTAPPTSRVDDPKPSLSPNDADNSDPFADRSHSRGTGLGLAICRDLITRAGGTIAVESPLTADPASPGTAFHLTLPLAPLPREST